MGLFSMGRKPRDSGVSPQRKGEVAASSVGAPPLVQAVQPAPSPAPGGPAAKAPAAALSLSELLAPPSEESKAPEAAKGEAKGAPNPAGEKTEEVITEGVLSIFSDEKVEDTELLLLTEGLEEVRAEELLTLLQGLAQETRRA